MSKSDLYDIVDADARIIYKDGQEEQLDSFFEIIPKLNEPLSRDSVAQYLEAKREDRNKTMNSGGQEKVDAAQREIQKMSEEYYNHISEFDVEVDVHYDHTGDGRIDKTRTLQGDPRTDLDMRTGIFPSILPLQFEDSEEYLVLREIKPYDREFIREYVSKEADFTGRNGSAFDWNFYDNLMEGEHEERREQPNTFSYVPEPIDFLAINGIDGYNEKVKEEDEMPFIADHHWKVIDMDEKQETMIGLRPFYDQIWDGGVTEKEAEKVGRWRGANRAIGRTLYDMDDEFFHGFNGDSHFIGFYDNEFPFVVGSERAFDGDEWQRFKQNFSRYEEENAGVPSNIVSDHIQTIRDEELRLAEVMKNDDLDINYSELIERSVDPSLIPEEIKANKIF